MASLGGPNIITNGLVLQLDAANAKSYPGSGTVWRDLSGNNNSGSLVNGPIFDSANGGSILFNGTNQWVSGSSNPVLTNQITIELWINLDTSNITGAGSSVASYIIGRENNYRIIASLSGVFDFVCATVNNGWYSPGTAISSNPSPRIWTHIVGIYDSAKLLMYQNSILISTGSAISGNILSTGTNLGIMQSQTANVTFGKGNGAAYRIYNRALSAAEVLQNYNATKARFNL